jgi:hypothetical protein
MIATQWAATVSSLEKISSLEAVENSIRLHDPARRPSTNLLTILQLNFPGSSLSAPNLV